MDLYEAAAAIRDGMGAALSEKRGFLVGRTGTIELEVLLSAGSVSRERLAVLERNAGVFPANLDSALIWLAQTQEAIRSTDLLVAGWYEPLARSEAGFLARLGKQGPFLPLRSLEPYYVSEELMWSRLMAGRRVAVVSSFAVSACAQAIKANLIWGDRYESLLPAATYVPIVTGYAPILAAGRAEWPAGCSRWQEAVGDVVRRVVETNAEIVLIGCGGLGMLIGARLKALGKVCIVIGGATQVLFGIKGIRWANHSVISRFWNSAWVWPAVEETPRGATAIEGGCYWGPQGL